MWISHVIAPVGSLGGTWSLICFFPERFTFNDFFVGTFHPLPQLPFRELRFYLRKKSTVWNVSVRPCYLSDFDWLCFVFDVLFRKNVGKTVERFSATQRKSPEAVKRENAARREFSKAA